MKFTAYSLITVIAAASTVIVSARTPLLRGQRALDGVPSAKALQAEINAIQIELNELESKEGILVIVNNTSSPDSDEELDSNSTSIDSYSDSSEEEANRIGGMDSNSTSSLDSDEELDSNSTSIDSYSSESEESTSVDSSEEDELDEATQQYDSEMADAGYGNDYGFGMDMDPEFYGTDLVHYHEPEFENTPQTPDDNSELPVIDSNGRYLVTAKELQAEIEHLQVELNELEAGGGNGEEGEDLDEATDLYNSEMEAEAKNNGGGDPFGIDVDPEYMGEDFESYVEPELEDTPVTPRDGSELVVLDPDMD